MIKRGRFQILIIEDNEKIYRGLKHRLNILLKTDRYLYIPDVENISTFDAFKAFLNKIEINKPNHYNIILDVNLGPGREEEGLIIFKYIVDNGLNFIKTMVYSGHPGMKLRFLEYGLASDSFLVKADAGGYAEDLKRIENVIKKNFEISCKNGLLLGIDLLIVQESTSFRQYIELPLDIHRLSISNDAEKLFFLQFLTNPIKPGLYIFSINGKIWNYKANEIQDADSPSHLFVQIINPETGTCEGLQFMAGDKLVQVHFPDLKMVEASHSIISSYATRENNIKSYLVEFFLVKRMVDLFLKGTNKEKQDVITLYKKIYYKINKNMFIFELWEALLQIGNNNEGQEWKEFDEYIFEAFYYCEIEEVTDNSASVKLQNAENLNEIHYEDHRLQSLRRFGLGNRFDRFKYIRFQIKESLQDSHSIIPVPPNVKFPS